MLALCRTLQRRSLPAVCLSPVRASTQKMSTAAVKPEEEILVAKDDSSRILTLNRPKALNSLNLTMVQKMTPLLQAWNENELVDKVILKGAGGKAFCAGGDVRAIAEAGKVGGSLTKEFFAEEYRLNHLIGTYNKPIIALLNGITMGGGVGLSVHAPIRIATENTLFAMPETGIGLFPDVGGSFFLPRLDGELGMFLALTGHRLKGKDVHHAGIATHYVHSSKLEILERYLLTAKGLDAFQISELLEDFSDPTDQPFSLGPQLDLIDRCFSKNSVEEILEALNAENNNPWAANVSQTIGKMSPTSLKITFRQIRNGKLLDFAECFKMEYRLTQRVLTDKDFYEGIRAVLIDKDQKPVWDPATLPLVSDEYVQKHFEPLDERKNGTTDFKAFTERSYYDYPHKRTALPLQADILKSIARFPQLTLDEQVEKFRKEMGYQKFGAKAKIESVVRRAFHVSAAGELAPKL